MGIITGNVSVRRYRVMGTPPPDFRDRFVKGVRAHALVPIDPRKDPNNERAVGWCSPFAPADLDLDFDTFWLDGRIALGMRVDTLKPPADHVRHLLAQRQRDEEAKQKQPLSRAAVRALKEQIAAELRLHTPPKVQVTDMLWDLDQGRVYLFSQSKGPGELFAELFRDSFGLGIDFEGPGVWAEDLAEQDGLVDELESARPTAALLAGFAGLRPDAGLAGTLGVPPSGEMTDYKYLGREFLTWLLYHADEEGGGGSFSDKLAGEAGGFQVQMGGRVVLRAVGEDGAEIVARGPAPAQSADVRYAIAGGFSVREAELLLTRGERCFKLALSADLFDIRRAKLPEVIGEELHERALERTELLDELDGMLRAAYRVFLHRRLRPCWEGEQLGLLRDWLASACVNEEPAEAAMHARAA